MTQDDVNRMWEESSDDSNGMSLGYPSQQHYFAALVAAAEREECAKVCNDSAYSDANEYDDFSNGCNWCAGAIRARGQE